MGTLTQAKSGAALLEVKSCFSVKSARGGQRGKTLGAIALKIDKQKDLRLFYTELMISTCLHLVRTHNPEDTPNHLGGRPLFVTK
jgi:hypothetical protein